MTFAVYRATGASEINVAEEADAGLETIRAGNPDVTIDHFDDLVEASRGNYEAAITTLMEGAVPAVPVVLLFLRN